MTDNLIVLLDKQEEGRVLQEVASSRSKSRAAKFGRGQSTSPMTTPLIIQFRSMASCLTSVEFG